MAGSLKDHTLEFLLAFDGLIHWLENGYSLRFVIKKVNQTPTRPHGLDYSFTLHDGEGKRILGFDNAHSGPPPEREVQKESGHRGSLASDRSRQGQAVQIRRCRHAPGGLFQGSLSRARKAEDFFRCSKSHQTKGLNYGKVQDQVAQGA